MRTQYRARLTRWLDRLAHIDITIQHIAGSNLKFTIFLSRNPVEDATTKNACDEQYVMNILTEQAELNLQNGKILTNQYQHASNNKIHTYANQITNHKRREHSRKAET